MARVFPLMVLLLLTATGCPGDGSAGDGNITGSAEDWMRCLTTNGVVRPCVIPDCACSDDSDCMLHECGFAPTGENDCNMNWGDGSSCLGFEYAIPVGRWMELEESWRATCPQNGSFLCHDSGEGDTFDPWYCCRYEPECRQGNCVGVLIDAWCGGYGCP